MRITFHSFGHIQVANAKGMETYSHEAGETVNLPEDIAHLFIQSGVATPAAKTEKAVKPKGETATK